MRLPSSTPAATIAGSRIPNSKTLKVQLWDTVRVEGAHTLLSRTDHLVNLPHTGWARTIQKRDAKLLQRCLWRRDRLRYHLVRFSGLPTPDVYRC